MKRFLSSTLLLLGTLGSLLLPGCGQGGTEVGNPPNPAGIPGGEDTGMDQEPAAASPTPSPDSELNFGDEEDHDTLAEYER